MNNTPRDNQDLPDSKWIKAEFDRFNEKERWHSPVDLGHGIKTGTARTQKRFARRLRLLQIPADLSGMRVLDIGTWDGFFALEMEKRGADVVAIDIWDDFQYEKFQFVLKATGSQVKHHLIDVHEISPELLGEFDLVLCAGVLYHCRYPLIALEKIFSVTKGKLILETVTLIPGMHGTAPIMMLFPGDKEAIEKKWPWKICGAATLPWIHGALKSAGFTDVKHVYRPSLAWWKKFVALITNNPSSGRSITHAEV